MLANRRLDSPEKAQAFLNASLSQLRPPTSLKDLDKAVHRIARAITAGENILLFGDYDVDGTTATSVSARVPDNLRGPTSPTTSPIG